MRGILCAVLLAACAHTPAPVEGEKRGASAEQVMVADEPGLKVLAEPADAELVVDGQSYGKVVGLNGPVSLKPGIYQVSLKKEGYTTWRAEVTVGEKTEQLSVTLVKK